MHSLFHKIFSIIGAISTGLFPCTGSSLFQHISPNHLAPTSIVQPATKVTPLTPNQEELMQQVFLRSDLKSMLDKMVEKVLCEMGDSFDSEMIQLSQPVSLRDESKEGKKAKKTKKTKKEKIRTLGQWMNASVTNYLLREIRFREITYRNTMRSEGKWPEEIERDLNEMRQIMPTEGIEFYSVKGTYVLAYKEFVLLLHAKNQKLTKDFDLLIQGGKKIFERTLQGRRCLTAYQLSNTQRKQLCQQWSMLELPSTPSEDEEWIKRLDKYNKFFKLARPGIIKIYQHFERLLRWAFSENTTNGGENSKPPKIRIEGLISPLIEIKRQIESFFNMPQEKTSEVIIKIYSGRDLLKKLSNLLDQIMFECTDSKGILFMPDHVADTQNKNFDWQIILKEIKKEEPNEAHQTLSTLLTDLGQEVRDLGKKLIQLPTSTTASDVVLLDLVKIVVRSYQNAAKRRGIEIMLDEKADKRLTATTLSVDLELLLKQMIANSIYKLDSLERLDQKKKLVINIAKEEGGEGKACLTMNSVVEKIAAAKVEGENTGGRRKQLPMRFIPLKLDSVIKGIEGEMSDLNGTQTLRIPLQIRNIDGGGSGLPSQQQPSDLRTLSPERFHEARDRYLDKTSKGIIKDFLSESLRQELNGLNKIGDLTLGSVSLTSGKSIEELMACALKDPARIAKIKEIINFDKILLRQLADLTGLRLSEIVENLPISRRYPDTLSSMEFRTLNSNGRQADRKLLAQQLAKIQIKPNQLVFLRLITKDPAGNRVEQLVVDRMARLQEYAGTLGSISSYDKFLFNARRTFDLPSREIILDEIYLDLQSKGHGEKFHRAQMRAFLNAGFVNVRIREDTASLVTMNWLEGARIDWKGLAFKEHWLKSMRPLFDELAIPIIEPITSEKILDALKKVKRDSTSFDKFLGIIFGSRELGRLLKESDENGFVEFLRFRIIGYGRRQVILQKLRKELEELPELCWEEKEDGLEALEDEEKDFWTDRIRPALEKLRQGRAKAGILTPTFLPDFSKGSPERLQAYQIAEQLLQEHEFGLSLVVNLQEFHGRESSMDYMEALNKVHPDLFTAVETVSPNFVPQLKIMDAKSERFDHFWEPAWPKPNIFHRDKAKAFHALVCRTNVDLNYVGSRIYSKQICSLFYAFPIVREMLAKQDGILGVGRMMEALFYYNPQLLGILLRSSQEHLNETRKALSQLSDPIIARILDLEVVPVPSSTRPIETSTDVDPFHMLKLLEPDEIYQESYSQRVKRILNLVSDRTLAILLQQSYSMYKPDLREGWMKSVFLYALRGMENDPHFLRAMNILKGKNKNELNDAEAWNWVNNFFTKKHEDLCHPLGAAPQFVAYARSKIDSEHSQRLLGRVYNKADIYGPFMHYFRGFIDVKNATEKAVTEQRKGASAALSEIFKIDPEIAGIIVRSTEEAYHERTLFLLYYMPVEDAIKIFNRELIMQNRMPFYVPLDEVENFNKLDHFAVLNFVRHMFLNARQSNSIVDRVWVERVLINLEPEALAAILQHMWINADNPRFTGIADDLQELHKIFQKFDPKKWECVLELLRCHDRESGQNVTLWVNFIITGGDYPDTFYKKLNDEHPWVAQRWLQEVMGIDDKLLRYSKLLESYKTDIMTKDVFEEGDERIFQYLEEMVSNLSSEGMQTAFLIYSRLKMEMNRILMKIRKNFYDHSRLNPQQKALFLFQLLEPELDQFFVKDVFQKKGLSGFECVTPGKAILRVKVIGNPIKEGARFHDLRKGDLVITHSFPENSPRITQPGAILLGAPVSVNGHAYELAKTWGFPCAFFHCAQQIFKDLDGQIVVFEISKERTLLRLANDEEKKQFEDNPQKDSKLTAFNQLQIPDVCLGEGESQVIELDRMTPAERRRVGYKAMRLGRVKRDKEYPIPNGFCITFAGYQAFLQHNHMEEKMRELLRDIDQQEDQEIKYRLHQIREMFLSGEFPSSDQDLAGQILSHLKALGEGKLFVRSSSNVEDLPGYSGAGRLQTYGPIPNIEEVVLKNIRQVMASLWDDLAFENRRAHGVKGEEHLRAKASVFVQKAVSAAYSGVLVTRADGNKNTIEISINEKEKGAVEDPVEGRPAPHILYTYQKTIERRFEDHPLFWQDARIGLSELAATTGKLLFPQHDPSLDFSQDPHVRKVVLAVVHTQDEQELTNKIEQLLNETKLPGNAQNLAVQLRDKLNAINLEQERLLFIPLFKVGQEVEELFAMAPLLLEFAVDQQGEIIPLQVKGHDGVQQISFRVKVLNKGGIHARPAANLYNLLEKAKVRIEDEESVVNYFKNNVIYFKKLDLTNPQPSKEIDNVNSLMSLYCKKGDEIQVSVSGKDFGQLLKIGKIIREFFLDLCLDYTGDEVRDPDHLRPAWDDIVDLMNTYIEEDDTSNPKMWGDMDSLRAIYEKTFVTPFAVRGTATSDFAAGKKKVEVSPEDSAGSQTQEPPIEEEGSPTKITFEVTLLNGVMHTNPSENLRLMLKPILNIKALEAAEKIRNRIALLREEKNRPKNYFHKNTIFISVLGKDNDIKGSAKFENKEDQFFFNRISKGIENILNGCKLRFTITGDDAFEIAKILRGFFVGIWLFDNHLTDWKTGERKKPLFPAAKLFWGDVEETFEVYYEGDDLTTPHIWDDMEFLRQIYDEDFGEDRLRPSEELEAAI